MSEAEPPVWFTWSDHAVLWDSDGTKLDPAGFRAQSSRRSFAARDNGVVIDIAERPEARALRSAFRAATGGREFAIVPCQAAPSQPEHLAELVPEPCFQTLTSGTTGGTRRIRRTHASWIRSFHENARLWGISPADNVAVLGRLSYSLSLYGAMEALHLGCDLHLLSELRPDRQLAALAARRITIIYATPAQLRLLLASHGAQHPDPVPSVRVVLVGGAKLDEATRSEVSTCFPAAAVREFYGAAETSFVTLSDAHTPTGSVGRAYPGVEIEIRAYDGDLLPAGEVGEVWVRSPYLFTGYAAGAARLTRWRDRFLSVGEMGWLDTGGYLYLRGRKNRMVTIADQNLSLDDVEAFLLTLPGIIRAAAVALPDRKRGHLVHVAVESDGDGLSDDEILATCRGVFGVTRAPRAVHRPKEWPVLASGKTDLKAVEAVAAAPREQP